MGKLVVKCSKCNMYYDGGAYEKCPYCKNSNSDHSATIRETPVQFIGKDINEGQKPVPNKKTIFGKNKKNQHGSPKDNKHSDMSRITMPADTEMIERNKTKEIQHDSVNSHTSSPVEKSYEKTQPLLISDVQNNLASLQNKNTKESSNTSIPRMTTIGRFIPQNRNDTKKAEDDINSTLPENVGAKHDESLMTSIRNSGLTQGRFIMNTSTGPVAPVVGWLVCIKGQEIGKSFQLKKGRNKIGRSLEMDIKLLNEISVSRTCQAELIYDPKAREYSLLPGESDTLCYLNGKAVYDRKSLVSRDILEFGDSGKNKYMFVEFCNQDFDWSMIEEERG